MKPTKKKTALFGIIIPSLIFIIYGIISYFTDPYGVVLTDMLVKIPIMFIALKILHRAKPVERKAMPGKRMAAMLAVFAVAVCVPTQLMAHMAASAGPAKGLEIIPKSLLTAPILEEIVYRGLIFGTARTVFGFWPSLIVSAFWFQTGHLVPGYAVVTIPVSVSTSAMYELTGSLKYSILMHAVFNFIAFFFAFVSIPMIIALPIYAASLALSVLTLSRRDALARILRVQARKGRLLCG